MTYQDVTLYHLKFVDRHGLEITAEGLSAGELLDLMDLTAKFADQPDGEQKFDPAMRATVGQLMEVLAGALVEWNIVDRNDEPVPADLAGVKSLKLPLLMDIVTAWTKAQAEVGDDLGKDSPPGVPSGLGQPIPMAPRSASPGN